jgi:fucose permease
MTTLPITRTRPISLLLIAYFTFIAIAVPDGVLNIAWTYMQVAFDVPLESLGVLIGVAMVGRLVTAFTSGALIGRFGVIRYLVGGMFLMLVGFIGYAVAPSWEMLLIAAAVTAMGSGALDAGMNTFVSAGYTTGQLNWLHAAYGVGVTLGPVLATYVILTGAPMWDVSPYQAWRVAYWLAAIPAALVIVLFLITRKGWTLPSHMNSEKIAVPAASIRESLMLPLVLLGALIFFLYGAAEIGVGNLSNTLFVEGRAAPQDTASFWISLYWASFTIGRIIMGFIADRFNPTVIMRACMVGCVVGAAMYMLNPIPVIGYLGIAVMGFSFAPMFATLIALTPHRVGERHAPNAIGIQVGIVGIGGALLPFIAGILSRSFGLEVIGVVVFISTLLLLTVHEVMLRRAGDIQPGSVG